MNYHLVLFSEGDHKPIPEGYQVEIIDVPMNSVEMSAIKKKS